MYGNDYRYAATRLDDSIARLVDGTPVYIHSVEESGVVNYLVLKELGLPGTTSKRAKLESFNLEPVPLGYINSKTGCKYIQRIPVRKWKQGLRVGENCNVNNANVDYVALAQSIQGVYPSFKDVVSKNVTIGNNPFKKPDNPFVIAWHRHWSLDKKNNSISYRGDVVGSLVDGYPKLLPQYKYLQECLEESL